MNSAIERLLSLRVGDVMKAQVRELSAGSSMSEAAECFLKHQISGAPVVDDQHRCVGILSALDFVRREHDLVAGKQSSGKSADSLSSERIEQTMTRAVKSVTRDTTLMQAARVMCEAHVHRLPVLDVARRPIGMISSMDVVAAMVQAIEE